MMGIRRVFGFVISLFDFINIDNIIRDEVPRSGLLAGLRNFLAGIFLFLLSSFAMATLSVVYLMLVYDTTSSAAFIVTPKPAITAGFLLSSLRYFGLITFPYLFFGVFLHQGMVNFMVKVLLGGKGTYTQQYFLSSYITLALGIASLGIPFAAIMGIFLPCLLLFFALTFLAATIYLGIYVQAKMLMAVHKIDFVPAFVVSLLVSLGSLAAYIVLQLMVAKYGLGPDYTATFGILGADTSLISIPGLSGG